MHLIPKETVVSILGHLNERERIRLLSTCKRMREWLKERLTIARNAFDAFKAHCTTVGWEQDDWGDDDWGQLSHHRVLHLPRGTKYLSTYVCLEANGLIYILQTEDFHNILGWNHPSIRVCRYFAPWFHELTSFEGEKLSLGEPDSVVRMLLDASPRLV
jgi:hypothetical protein